MHLGRMPPVFHGREISVPRNTSHAGYTTYIPETPCFLPSNYPWHSGLERTGQLHLGDFNRMPFHWSGQCALLHDGTSRSTITGADVSSCESNENSAVRLLPSRARYTSRYIRPIGSQLQTLGIEEKNVFGESQAATASSKGSIVTCEIIPINAKMKRGSISILSMCTRYI